MEYDDDDDGISNTHTHLPDFVQDGSVSANQENSLLSFVQNLSGIFTVKFCTESVSLFTPNIHSFKLCN
jgi:hypothetical protein